MTPRIMPDPIPWRGGLLTATELAACVSVLRALRSPVCASTVLTWGSEETRAYVSLSRVGYVFSLKSSPWYEDGPAPCKLDAPFRWDKVAATPAGLEWLRQIERGV